MSNRDRSSDSAVRRILAAAHDLAEELGETRHLTDQIARFWLKLRQVVPLASNDILTVREIIAINSTLLRAQELGIVSRDIDLTDA